MRLANPGGGAPGRGLRDSALARLGSATRRFGLPFLRPAVGLAVLWFLWQRVGGAPFRAGLAALTWPTVLAAALITAATTLCSAWRWRVAARALGLDITMPAAFGAYYRSLFLNSVLVGGALGDVHRAIRHGVRSGHVGRGARAVAWERLWGQVVQALATAAVLVVFPSPFRPVLPYLLGGVAAAAGCAAAVIWAAAHWGGARVGRTARAARDDLRRGLLARGVGARLTVASLLVVGGHTLVFAIAADRVAGSRAPLGELLALLMVIQVAAVIPLSIGGWGPREAAAAGAFAAAGLGAGTGVTVTTFYAVLMLIALAPGAALLVGDAFRLRRGRSAASRSKPVRVPLSRQASGLSGNQQRGTRFRMSAPSRTRRSVRAASRPE